MKNLLACILPVLMIVSLIGCEPKEDILTTDPNAMLSFSEDTVIFDTVFTSIGTVTKRLKVYNNNSRAVNISEIRLGKENQSAYRLIINGKQSSFAQNIELRGNDSLYVLVSAEIDPNNQNTPLIVTDSVVFLTNNNRQHVKLRAWGQDAYFYYSDTLDCNAVWRADKPHVIYDGVVVLAGCQLTIEPGAKVYLHGGGIILVDGSLQCGIGGDSTNMVTFAGDRLEDRFDNVPGQWDGIYFLPNSQNNRIQFTEIKNAVYGIRAGSPDADPGFDITIENSIIRNMFAAGILSFTTDIRVVNTLIHNCGQYTVAGLAGGNYSFEYCTFANYSPQFNRRNESFVFTDFLQLADGSVLREPYTVNLVNSIVWGQRGDGKPDEVLLANDGGTTSNVSITNSILKTEAFKTSFEQIPTVLVNTEPRFRNPSNFNFNLTANSPANNAAAFIPAIPTDIVGKTRSTTTPDIGAYELVD